MEAISKTFSQDESIDEALEATNFSIVEIDLSSSSSASNDQDNRHCSSAFSIYTMAISETSYEYQSITRTGGRETRYELKQHQPFRRMNRSSCRCTANNNSLSFSSSDGIHERGTSTDSNDDDDVYSIPDVEMKKVFQVLPNKEIIPVWVQDSDRGPDFELFASNSKSPSSSSVEMFDRQRTTPLELTLLPLDGRGGCIDGETVREDKRTTSETKSKAVDGFRVVSPTQHLSGNWCGVNFCANDKAGVLDDSTVDPPTTCANECDQEQHRDTELERVENGPATPHFPPLLGSATQIDEKDGPSTSRHTESSSFRRSKRRDLDARSARLMSRMVDRAIRFQQSSRTIMSHVDDSQEESASLDDATGEQLSQDLGSLFAEFWQNPRNFFEIYACLKAPQAHDSMGAYVISTHTESTTGSDDEAGCIPEHPSSVEPTTSDDSFRSDEQEKQECHKPMVDIIMGLTSKLNRHQEHVHESSQPSKCREVIDSSHSVGNHLRRTVMILSDDDLSEASDLFSDCDENRCFSRFLANSVNDAGASSKPPLYAARYNHVATAPPCHEHHLNRIERHLPELMGSMKDSDMGYDSEREPNVTFPDSRDGTADNDYDDDSLIDYAELERDLLMEEQHFFAASRYQYQSFSAPTNS